MKAKLSVLAIFALNFSSGFGAVYNVTTGTVASSNGIAPSGLVSNIGATAVSGTFNGYQSPASTGIVAFGIFSSLSDSQITNAVSLDSLVSSFIQFGASGGFNAAGAFGSKGVFTRNTSATVLGSSFSNKNIYALAGNGSTFANSTELLVLKSASLFTDAQDDIPTAQTVTLTTGTATLLFGVNLADVRTTTADASVTPGWGTAKVIPEPSAALLGAVGVLGLLRRRRD